MEEGKAEQHIDTEVSESAVSTQDLSSVEAADEQLLASGSDQQSSEEEEELAPPAVIKINKMSVDFLAPKPIQDGADLSSQWTRFREEFELFLTAAEKSDSDDKINVAIMLRYIGQRGTDIFKSFTFPGGKSKDK